MLQCSITMAYHYDYDLCETLQYLVIFRKNKYSCFVGFLHKQGCFNDKDVTWRWQKMHGWDDDDNDNEFTYSKKHAYF